LRQEIYIAFISQRSVRIALTNHTFDRTFEPTDDCTWADRAVAHCADVLGFCFSEDDGSAAGGRGLARYCDLVEYGREWLEKRPTSFIPIYYREPQDNEVFPQVWYIGDCHGVCSILSPETYDINKS
jgi:hypothetical protein